MGICRREVDSQHRITNGANRAVGTFASIAIIALGSMSSSITFDWFSPSSASTAIPSPPALAPMKIHFVPGEYATHYTATVPSGDRVTYAWTLTPPSVDPGCDNHGILTSTTNQFVWHHPDAVNSQPPGWYHCNHKIEGPVGHLGTVSVVIIGLYDGPQGANTPAWRCTASYLGTNAPDGSPDYSTAFTCLATVSSPTIGGTTSSSGFPLWIVGVAGVVVIAIGLIILARRRTALTKNDCDELRQRCLDLRAQAAAAQAKAQQAAAAARAADAAVTQAQHAVADAQHNVDVLTGPDQSSSWVEDPETGRRITEYDLALQRADETASGQVSDYSPQYQAQLRQKAIDRANAALTTAQAKLAQAQQAASVAHAEAAAAASAAASIAAQAEEACAAADECEKQLASPTPSAPPLPPTPPPPPAPPVTPPPVAPPPVTHVRTTSAPQCKEGDVRDGTPKAFDVELFPLALLNLRISKVYQMSNQDVEDAMRGFEKFKAVVDFAEIVESFAGSAGDFVEKAVSLDTALNVFTTGVGVATNAFDPGATLEDSTIDLLKEVIKRVNLVREAGHYSMTCPLVRVHVSCTPTEVCGGGHWNPGKPRFLITYGETIRPVTKEIEGDPVILPGEAARAIERLRGSFVQANARPLQQIRDAANSCAQGN